MTRAPAAGDSECIALAVELFREPSRFSDLLHGRRRLPHGVTALLQMAAGNRSHQAGSRIPGNAQQAARFFIEQVLMAHNATHYRVLGVDQTAPPEIIKEHHRLLMRLFHPDRQAAADERSDAIATRINQAYTVLRYPDTRATYDLSLTDQRDVKSATPVHMSRKQPVTVDSPTPPIRMPQFVVRHLPQFALGSVALVAALGVALVYLSREPTDAIGTGKGMLANAQESEAPPAIPTAIARTHPKPLPPELPPIDVRPMETTVPVAVSMGEHEPTTMPTTIKLAIATPVKPPLPEPEQASKRISPAPVFKEAKPIEPAPANSVTPVAVDHLAAPEIKPSPPSLRRDQLNSLVARLTEQYQRGDVNNLLELFDASAHIERGDKTQIRAEYSELFRNSENRTLYIWDVIWSGDGRIIRGEGSFQTQVVRKGEQSPKVTNGAVTIEVIQRNDRPLIVGLYQKADH